MSNAATPRVIYFNPQLHPGQFIARTFLDAMWFIYLVLLVGTSGKLIASDDANEFTAQRQSWIYLVAIAGWYQLLYFILGCAVTVLNTQAETRQDAELPFMPMREPVGFTVVLLIGWIIILELTLRASNLIQDVCVTWIVLMMSVLGLMDPLRNFVLFYAGPNSKETQHECQKRKIRVD